MSWIIRLVSSVFNCLSHEFMLTASRFKKHTNFYRKTISHLLFYDKKFTQNDMFFNTNE